PDILVVERCTAADVAHVVPVDHTRQVAFGDRRIGGAVVHFVGRFDRADQGLGGDIGRRAGRRVDGVVTCVVASVAQSGGIHCLVVAHVLVDELGDTAGVCHVVTVDNTCKIPFGDRGTDVAVVDLVGHNDGACQGLRRDVGSCAGRRVDRVVPGIGA